MVRHNNNKIIKNRSALVLKIRNFYLVEFEVHTKAEMNINYAQKYSRTRNI